ncbi:hypothetical protein HII36_03315 [Nonomuraea sp. NN258]|uniref:hypothetical protein n=1 Tax=Nonomuraea antri TaxID=2730852 RepID=UPI001569205B|nr:hypothetical protein [Nonomuraea antri]NRQ30868.1 hypothetical protein [Nonomuraea antri]
MSEAGKHTLSRAALARLAVAHEAADASDGYRALVARGRLAAHQPGEQAIHQPGEPAAHRPGELAGAAWRLLEQARGILRNAVIAERLAGTSWEMIGEQLGEISKQAAHERYGAAETVFRRAALMAWLIPERAFDQIGELADPDAALARLNRFLHPPPEPGDRPSAGSPRTPGPRRTAEPGQPPPGHAEPTIAEQAALVAEATDLLRAQEGAQPAEYQRRAAELGLARRKVALYEAVAAERPDDIEHADLLTGARARLAALEADAARNLRL